MKTKRKEKNKFRYVEYWVSWISANGIVRIEKFDESDLFEARKQFKHIKIACGRNVCLMKIESLDWC